MLEPPCALEDAQSVSGILGVDSEEPPTDSAYALEALLALRNYLFPAPFAWVRGINQHQTPVWRATICDDQEPMLLTVYNAELSIEPRHNRHEVPLARSCIEYGHRGSGVPCPMTKYAQNDESFIICACSQMDVERMRQILIDKRVGGLWRTDPMVPDLMSLVAYGERRCRSRGSWIAAVVESVAMPCDSRTFYPPKPIG